MESMIYCFNIFIFFSSVNAGCIALPALLNINHVLANSRVVDILKDKDELPVSLCILSIY